MKNNMKKISCAILFYFFYSVIQGQINVDSLQRSIQNMPNDTGSLSKIIEIGKIYMQSDLDVALIVFKAAETRVFSIDNNTQKGTVLIAIANIFNMQSNAKEASNYYQKAKELGEKINDKKLLLNAYNGIGALCSFNKENTKSLEAYTKALQFCSEKDSLSKCLILGNIGLVYYNLCQTNDEKIAGGTRYEPTMLTKAIEYNRNALWLAQHLHKDSRTIDQAVNLCLEFTDFNKLDSASYYLNIASNLVEQTDNLETKASYNANKGRLLRAKKEYANAILAYQISIDLGSQLGTPQWVYEGYYSISETYSLMGEDKKAFAFLNKYITLKDSVLSADNFAAAADIQNKYDREKKEKELVIEKTANQQKSTLNKILMGSAAALLFIGFLGYRNFRSRQKLQQAKITELEKDKQLLAIDAMLQGQEEERSRIAKDLHDGLGGMLSGTKLSFVNMKENLVLTPENAKQFDKSLSMLDNTIADLRKVAHNLMPEALVKFGLQEAVRDFCNSVQSSTNLKVVYQPLGDNRKLSNTAEVFTYRIVQELVNNAVKHANATQIIVQLTTNNNKVGIAVEDNGKGFDANALANSKGAGMDNIKYRVQYFNGTIDTVTSAGNGTSVNIELSV
jgi:two-component system, NarL family, sensor kinase